MIEIHRKGGKELVGKKKTKAEELFELSKNVATGEIPVETKEQQSKREEAEMLRKSVEDEYNSLILVCRNKAGQGKFCVELFCKLYDYSIVIAIYTEEELEAMKEERAEVPVLEEKYLRLDGSSVDVEVAAAPFIYLGKPGAQVIARDITERKKMENIFKKERDKAQLYLDIAGVMLVAIDADQKVTLINKNKTLSYGDLIG